MSQSGQITFYRSERLLDPIGQLRAVIAHTGASGFELALRTIGPDDAWDRYRASGGEDAFPPDEQVGVGMDLPSLSSEYRENSCLSIILDSCPLGHRIHRVVRTIDEDIRGDFCPSQVHLGVGYHDLFESAEHEDGFLIARAFFSIRFWGYSTPHDWDAFRSDCFTLSAMLLIKKELEALVGSLSECAFWDT
jgi:hypothetical protein